MSSTQIQSYTNFAGLQAPTLISKCRSLQHAETNASSLKLVVAVLARRHATDPTASSVRVQGQPRNPHLSRDWGSPQRNMYVYCRRHYDMPRETARVIAGTWPFTDMAERLRDNRLYDWIVEAWIDPALLTKLTHDERLMLEQAGRAGEQHVFGRERVVALVDDEYDALQQALFLIGSNEITTGNQDLFDLVKQYTRDLPYDADNGKTLPDFAELADVKDVPELIEEVQRRQDELQKEADELDAWCDEETRFDEERDEREAQMTDDESDEHERQWLQETIANTIGEDALVRAMQCRLMWFDYLQQATELQATGVTPTSTAPEPSTKTKNEPLLLFRPPPSTQPFPIENLGPVLADAARAIAQKVQVSLAMAAQSVLAAAALAAQPHADVIPLSGEPSPLSLYIISVAVSGDRKSTADKVAQRGVKKYARLLFEKYKIEKRNWEYAVEIWTAQKERIKKNLDLNADQRREALEQLGDKPLPPLTPLLTSTDPTVEGLTKTWEDAPASQGIYSTEGSQLIGGYGFQNDQIKKTASALSKLWDGDPYDRVRATDNTVMILYGRRLSIHLMVQPKAAAEFLTHPMLLDQGLLSRILACAPESIIGTRIFHETTAEIESAINYLEERLYTVLDHPWPLCDDPPRNELRPRALTIDGEAREMLVEFYNAVEVKLGRECKYHIIEDFGSKTAEQAARIAGVLTIINNIKAEQITVEAMCNGIVIMGWYLDETLRLRKSGLISANSIANEILYLITENNGMSQALLTKNLKPRVDGLTIREALDLLLEHKLVRSDKIKTGRPGPPITMWFAI